MDGSGASAPPGRDEIAATAVRVLSERIAARGAPFEPEQYLSAYTVVDSESTAVMARLDG